MNIRFFSYCKYILVFSLAAISIAGCKYGEEKKSARGKYLLIVNGESGSRDMDCMLWFDSLDSNLVLHTDRASAINNMLGSAVILKNNFLITLDKKSGVLSKYRYMNDGLEPEGETTAGKFEYISFSTLLEDNHLFVSGRGKNNVFSYAIIDTGKMSVLQEGQLKLPVAKGQNPSDNFGVLKDKQLYVGYSSFGEDFDKCSDTSYLAVIDYPALSIKSVAKDTRSAFPGSGVNNMFNYIKDSNEDLYVLTSPVFYHGNHPTAPTAFYRIKHEESTFDKGYFFNLSGMLNGTHLLGITQAGPGKVILATTTFPRTKNCSFYLADVKAKSLKLLLADQQQPNYVWGTTGFYDGKNACFIVNEGKGKARIYVYNTALNTLRNGPAIEGEISEKSSYLMLRPSVSVTE